MQKLRTEKHTSEAFFSPILVMITLTVNDISIHVHVGKYSFYIFQQLISAKIDINKKERFITFIQLLDLALLDFNYISLFLS